MTVTVSDWQTVRQTTDRHISSDRQTDGQTDHDQTVTDRQTDSPPPPREWARRRTPGPRPRGLGGPAQGNREYVGGHKQVQIVMDTIIESTWQARSNRHHPHNHVIADRAKT